MHQEFQSLHQKCIHRSGCLLIFSVPNRNRNSLVSGSATSKQNVWHAPKPLAEQSKLFQLLKAIHCSKAEHWNFKSTNTWKMFDLIQVIMF